MNPDITNRFYDKMMLDLTKRSLLHETVFGKIIGYRKVKVPKYLTVKVPVITRDYDDFEYGDGEFRGWLISFKEVNVCKIGTKTEKQPIYKKRKRGGVISFKRYGEL